MGGNYRASQHSVTLTLNPNQPPKILWQNGCSGGPLQTQPHSRLEFGQLTLPTIAAGCGAGACCRRIEGQFTLPKALSPRRCSGPLLFYGGGYRAILNAGLGGELYCSPTHHYRASPFMCVQGEGILVMQTSHPNALPYHRRGPPNPMGLHAGG